jgi:hypothetical protein
MARSTPPNAPSLPAYLGFQVLGLSAFFILLIPTVIYHTVLHLIPSKRPYPTWTLQRSIFISVLRLHLRCTTKFCLPRPKGKKDWKPDALVQRIVGHGTVTRCVAVPPVPTEWVQGVAAVGKGIVSPVEIPGFWTSENGACGQGDEPAKHGEKVLLYIPGGYVLLFVKSVYRLFNRNQVMGYGASHGNPIPVSILYCVPLSRSL